MSLTLILLAIVCAACSGLPALLLKRRLPVAGLRLAVGMLAVAAMFGIAGGLTGLCSGQTPGRILPAWLLGGGARVELDALSAFFLVPLFFISGLGAIYACGYWRRGEQKRYGGTFALFWGLLTAGIALLVIARQSVLFLSGWEFMALSAFFLICIEDKNSDARRAAWVYFIATHIATLCLFALFGLLRLVTGTLEFVPLAPGQAGVGMLSALFFLGLVSFGLKAGVLPLHFWLPAAHANAPSHVSAFLSGIILKVGIYGLLRLCGLLPEPPLFWGGLLLALGCVSGVLGVAFALAQHDLKRLLAYHSVENIGIILMGVGLAMVGRSLGRDDLIALGLAGAVLHVWNHSLFKSLLFFGAGAVVSATRTREIDHLGGLAKRMPWTAGLFLLGAVAICGLPPLNGFVSEWFVFLGLIRSAVLPGVNSWALAALAVPALALIGALALACFVKVSGVVFFGLPRTAAAERAREVSRWMLMPMGFVAAACVLIGLFPALFGPLLDRVVLAWLPDRTGAAMPAVASLSALGWLSVTGCGLLALLGLGGVFLRWLLRRNGVARACTWNNAYNASTARMQYTASSFADMIVHWFRLVLRPQRSLPDLARPFALASGFKSHVGDLVLDHLLLPFAHAARGGLARVRRIQHGLLHYYILYILAAVVVLLLWTIPLGELLTRLITH